MRNGEIKTEFGEQRMYWNGVFYCNSPIKGTLEQNLKEDFQSFLEICKIAIKHKPNTKVEQVIYTLTNN